ncbi:MAG TPA: hypothetical protein VGS00_00220, partial [Thermoanaerobaculia bacterium]|nr:hypothetical protein [Thermoanaerobaculia bacterium]
MIAQQAHTALLRSLFLAAVLGAALPALAADKAAPAPAPAAASPYDPPALTFPENSITLLEAVRLTLQHQPSIMIQQQATRTQQGAAQVATGQFDIVITGNLSFSLIQSSLVRSQFLAEKKKRDDLQKSIDEIKTTRDTALNAISEYQQLQTNPTGFRLSNTAEQSQFDVLNTTIRDTSDPAVRAIYEQLRSDLIKQGLSTNQKVFDQSVIELANEQQNLRNLGSIPKEQQKIDGSIDMKVSQPGRTGVTAGFEFKGSFESDRYKGKSNLEKLGGKGIEDVYNYRFG